MMKKIKFLILALLGIMIVPTVANADYEIFSSFNGNQGLLYTPYHGSILYRCPFAQNIELKEGWNSTNSNSCFASKDYQYWWANIEDDTIPRPYYNGTQFQLITAIKKKDNTYSPFVLNFPKKSGFFEVGTKKYVDYISTNFFSSPTEDYSSILRGPDGYGQVIGGVFLDGLIIHSYTRSVDYVDYSNIILYDASSGYGYYMELGVPLSANLDTSFFALIDAIYNYNGEIKCWNMQQNYVSSTFLGYLSLDDNFSKNDCPIINFKEKIKNQVYFFPEILDFYLKNSNNSLTSPIFVSTPQVDTGSSSSLAEDYKKCVSYYSDVKNLAYYSQKCGDDTADDETLNRVKVDSWNAETEAQTVIDELTGLNRNKCGRFAKAKKQYKEKYGEKFAEFYKDFSGYARNPEALDPKLFCEGEILGGNKPFFESAKEFWSNYRDSMGVVIGTVNGQPVEKNEFERALGTLEAFKRACNNHTYLATPYDNFWGFIRSGISWLVDFDNNENVCKYVNELEANFQKKYGNIVISPTYQQALKSDFGEDIINSSSGFVLDKFKELVNGLGASPIVKEPSAGIFEFLKKDYQEGVNASFGLAGYSSCGNGFGSTEWDYLAFFPLILLFMLIIKGKL